MMLIAVALLIAVGPEQLPGLVRRVGSAVGQFRSMSERLRADFTAGMEELDRATDVKGWTDIATPDFTGRDPAADSARPPNRPKVEDYDPASVEDGISSPESGVLDGAGVDDAIGEDVDAGGVAVADLAAENVVASDVVASDSVANDNDAIGDGSHTWPTVNPDDTLHATDGEPEA